MSNSSHAQSNQPGKVVQPWYKHRWPWLLMFGPFVAFVACGVTIWLTFSAVDPQIKDGVLKQGLKVTVPESNSGASVKQSGDSK
jgi:hypothetical protein